MTETVKQFKDMVKVEKFEAVSELLENSNAPQVMIDFIMNERDMTERKNAKRSGTKRKPTATQLENEKFAEQLENYFLGLDDCDKGHTSKDIQNLLEIEATPQKITAIMKQVEGIEKKTIKGKVQYFKGLASNDTVEEAD